MVKYGSAPVSRETVAEYRASGFVVVYLSAVRTVVSEVYRSAFR